MSEMSNQNSENNGVNRAGPVGEGSSPGRCFPVRHRGPAFFRSKPFDDDGKPIRGYRQRMMQEWK